MQRCEEHCVAPNSQGHSDVEHEAEEFVVELQVHEVQQHHEELDRHQDEQTREERRPELFLGVAEHDLYRRDHCEEDRNLDVPKVAQAMLCVFVAVGVVLFCDGAHANSILIRPGSGRRA